MTAPIRIAGTLLALTLALPAAAQTLYVRAGALVDVLDGRVRQDQGILIEDGRIAAVGDADEVRAPAGARVVDLSDSTVLPGLIDAHVHLTSDADLHGYRSVARSTIRDTLYGVKAARDTLMAGFTTVRNVGAAGYGDVDLRDAIDAGEFPGPRMVVSGPTLGITGGHCDNNLLPPEMGAKGEAISDGPWAVRAQVRENNKYRVDMIKYCATGGVLSRNTNLNAQQYTDKEMKALVDEAHVLGLKVAAHAHGTGGIKAAIRAGVDSVEHASLLDDEAIRMAAGAGTTLVMDVYVSDFILSEGEAAGILEESLAKEREVGAKQRETFRRAVDAGVNVVFGTDAGVYPHGLNGRQFAFMVEHGMTPMQAIQAATSKAAVLLDRDGEVGALVPGRWADLIAVDGDPIADIRELEDVDFVMKGGEIVRD
jgi:imidazolonepropionase-like amidohydrolase